MCGEFSDSAAQLLFCTEAKLRRNLELKWKPLAMFVIRIWSDFWVIVLKELTGISLQLANVINLF